MSTSTIESGFLIDGSTITIGAGNILSAAGGSGTVTTTGSPASGNLTEFSGTTSITNGNLSGDITTTNTLVTTLATVNSNVGTFGSSTSIPNFTVNGKGLITAAAGNAVVAPAGTLTGTTLNSTVVSSSLTSVGTLTSLTVTGAITANGGMVVGSGEIVTETEYNNGNSGTSATINFNNGNSQFITMTGNCTITFTAPSSGATSIKLRILQGSGGPYTITWPTSTWAGGVKALTATAAATDIAAIYYSGSAYFGVLSLNFM